jgi:hypothetical protein
MTLLAEAAGEAAVAEAAAQQVELDPFDVDTVAEENAARASAQATVMARSISHAAAQKAPSEAGSGLAMEEVRALSRSAHRRTLVRTSHRSEPYVGRRSMTTARKTRLRSNRRALDVGTYRSPVSADVIVRDSTEKTLMDLRNEATRPLPVYRRRK